MEDIKVSFIFVTTLIKDDKYVDTTLFLEIDNYSRIQLGNISLVTPRFKFLLESYT